MQVQIKVYLGVSAKQNDTAVFERLIDVNDSLQIPYENLVSTLKFLFGSSCVVTFNIK